MNLFYTFSAFFFQTLLHFFGGVTATAHNADWAQATLQTPATITWSQGDVFQSGWVMIDASNGSFTQVGWIEGPTTPLNIFVYSATKEISPSLQSFTWRTSTPALPVTVATSCDFGTNEYRDWVRSGGVWHDVANINLHAPCGAQNSFIYIQNEAALSWGSQLPQYQLPTSFTNVELNTTSGLERPQIRMGR